MGLSLRFFTFMHLVSSLLIFHLAIAHFTSSMQPHTLCHDQDRSALLKFIESLTINRYASRNPLSYPKVASWNQDEQNSDCCSWDGIKCDEDTGHVSALTSVAVGSMAPSTLAAVSFSLFILNGLLSQITILISP